MRLLLIALFLGGCAGPAPSGYNDDNMKWIVYDYHACSDVTVSMRYYEAANRSPACHIR